MKKIDINLILDLVKRCSHNIPVWNESNNIYEYDDTVSLYSRENSVLLDNILEYLIFFKVCSRDKSYLKFNPEQLKKISLYDFFY